MSKETELAGKILEVIGGGDNIRMASYCMTRLRLEPKDLSRVDVEALKKTEGVMGVVESAGQFQLILGPGVVTKVANEIESRTGIRMGEYRDLKAAIDDRNRTPFKLFLRRLASIFVPLIPAIVASGMIAGIVNVAIRWGGPAIEKHWIISMFNTIGWGIFTYLGIFVGINTAREFGGTPALGGLAGILIINPAIANVKLWGTTALVPGRGGLFGVLLAAWFIAWTEKRIRKYVPNSLDIIVTPTLALAITGVVTFFILQPMGGYLSSWITGGIKWLIGTGGALAGFVLAGTFLPLVMTGLHQGLTPIHMEFLNTLKMNPLLPILAMAGAGQVGAAFAVYFKTKNQNLKKVVLGALPVGMLGIGEPLIWGVTLPLGRPFITACIGAAFGGAWQAVMKTTSIAMGVSGLPLAFLISPGKIGNYLIGILISYVAGFIVTWIVGFDDPKEF